MVCTDEYVRSVEGREGRASKKCSVVCEELGRHVRGRGAHGGSSLRRLQQRDGRDGLPLCMDSASEKRALEGVRGMEGRGLNAVDSAMDWGMSASLTVHSACCSILSPFH